MDLVFPWSKKKILNGKCWNKNVRIETGRKARVRTDYGSEEKDNRYVWGFSDRLFSDGQIKRY